MADMKKKITNILIVSYDIMTINYRHKRCTTIKKKGHRMYSMKMIDNRYTFDYTSMNENSMSVHSRHIDVYDMYTAVLYNMNDRVCVDVYCYDDIIVVRHDVSSEHRNDQLVKCVMQEGDGVCLKVRGGHIDRVVDTSDVRNKYVGGLCDVVVEDYRWIDRMMRMRFVYNVLMGDSPEKKEEAYDFDAQKKENEKASEKFFEHFFQGFLMDLKMYERNIKLLEILENKLGYNVITKIRYFLKVIFYSIQWLHDNILSHFMKHIRKMQSQDERNKYLESFITCLEKVVDLLEIEAPKTSDVKSFYKSDHMNTIISVAKNIKELVKNLNDTQSFVNFFANKETAPDWVITSRESIEKYDGFSKITQKYKDLKSNGSFWKIIPLSVGEKPQLDVEIKDIMKLIKQKIPITYALDRDNQELFEISGTRPSSYFFERLDWELLICRLSHDLVSVEWWPKGHRELKCEEEMVENLNCLSVTDDDIYFLFTDNHSKVRNSEINVRVVQLQFKSLNRSKRLEMKVIWCKNRNFQSHLNYLKFHMSVRNNILAVCRSYLEYMLQNDLILSVYRLEKSMNLESDLLPLIKARYSNQGKFEAILVEKIEVFERRVLCIMLIRYDGLTKRYIINFRVKNERVEIKSDIILKYGFQFKHRNDIIFLIKRRMPHFILFNGLNYNMVCLFKNKLTRLLNQDMKLNFRPPHGCPSIQDTDKLFISVHPKTKLITIGGPVVTGITDSYFHVFTFRLQF